MGEVRPAPRTLPTRSGKRTKNEDGKRALYNPITLDP
jgi:hypothetical protein